MADKKSPIKWLFGKVGKREVILLFSSILFSLILLEMGSRVWLNYIATEKQFNKYALYTDIDKSGWQYSPHHYLNYYPTPNYKKGLTSQNSLGYRGEEFPVEKPEGEYRIVTIGGSTTFTSAVEDDEKSYPAQMENILKNDYGYNNVKVINAGVGGYNTWESLMNLQFRVLDLDPDLIVIYHSVNDITQRMVPPELYRGDNPGSRKQWSLPPVTLSEHSALYRIITRMLGTKEQIRLDIATRNAANYMFGVSGGVTTEEGLEVLRKNSPVYYERNIRNMVAIAKEHDVKVMLATFAYSIDKALYDGRSYATGYFRFGYRQHNVVLNRIARKHAIPIFDFASVMPDDKNLWAEMLHLNEEGALIKARLFAEFIDKNGLATK